MTEPLPFVTRLWFAYVAFFRVLFDGLFAARVHALAERGRAALPPAETPKALEAPERVVSDEELTRLRDELAATKKKLDAAKKAADAKPAPSHDAALQLLALLQREGRLVDFLEEDVSSFPDADIGAAARVVHTGCRKALRDHVKLVPVRDEEEGAKVTLPEGFDPASVKLTGNVQGKGPFTGTLRHRGWRATEVSLPVAIEGHDARVVAQAEVEL